METANRPIRADEFYKTHKLSATHDQKEPALDPGTIVEVKLTGEKVTILKPCEHLPRDPQREFSGQKYLARTASHSKSPLTECEFTVVSRPNNERNKSVLSPGTTVRVNLTGELLAILAPCVHEDSDPEFKYTGQKYVVRTADRRKKTIMACEITTVSDTNNNTKYSASNAR